MRGSELRFLKRILKALENIETNTRRMLLLMEVDVDVGGEAGGGPGGKLMEALEALNAVPAEVIAGVLEAEDPDSSRRVGVF